MKKDSALHMIKNYVFYKNKIFLEGGDKLIRFQLLYNLVEINCKIISNLFKTFALVNLV